MKKVGILIFFIGVCLFFTTGCNKKEDTDALLFKKEYESLNDTSNTAGLAYRTITIPEDNPFVYITAEELVKKIEQEETFYIYFGSSYCPWCRSVLEKFIPIAKENNVQTVYYFNIWDNDHVENFRDVYVLNDKKEPVLQTEGTSSYKMLLNYLDNVLEDYTLTDKDGNTITVPEKRIYAPNFIYVESGKAIKLATGISEKQENSRAELTEEILEEEETIFQSFFGN